MKILGVDPGKSGAVALISDSGPFLTTYDIPLSDDRNDVDVHALWDFLEEVAPDYAYIERAIPMPHTIRSKGEGMPAARAFAFGRTIEAVNVVVRLLLIPYEFVMPAVWKRYFGLPKGSDKADSQALAYQRFPQHQNLFVRPADAGRAEASLIALYGWEDQMRMRDDGSNTAGKKTTA